MCATICGTCGGGGGGDDDDGVDGSGGSNGNSHEQVESVAMYEEAVSCVCCSDEYVNRRDLGAAAHCCSACGTVFS